MTKKNVHLIPHTHWDREWYYTSVSSKAMLYWDMKYLIDYLLKNPKAQFTYDGQSSIIDDFLEYAPEWEEKLRKVIKSKQLLLGPWYTQTDNLQPAGESIIRNLEIGGKLAHDFGHRMNVGYLPDSFGHNPQTPQIMKMVDIDNFTFYRGLDPKKVDNQLYFDYIAPSGDKVLGIWQTHYFTSSKWDNYEGFMKTGYKDRNTTGEVTVESYDKRTSGLPFWITVGGDMRNFRPGVNDVCKKLNENQDKFNFSISNYEDLVIEVQKEIKENNIILKQFKGELRASYTGRAHRSIMSARMDVKQKLFELENILINNIEPLSIIASREGIDVPWKMIERAWKDVFKTSAHDSYGGCVEEIAYRKMMQRLEDGILVARGISSMLMKIWSAQLNILNKSKKQLFIANTKPFKYTGNYEFKISYEPEEEGEQFKKFEIYDGNKKIPYFIKEKFDGPSHNREVYKVVMYIEELESLSIKKLDIKYGENSITKFKESSIENEFFAIEISNDKVNVLDKRQNRTYDDVLYLEADASNGDTYDHSPITWNDRKYRFDSIRLKNNFENNGLKTLELEVSGLLPNGLTEWTNNEATTIQKATIIVSLFKEEVVFTLNIQNTSDNARVKVMFNTGEEVETWDHDMQFSIIERKVKNEYMDNWEIPDKNGDKWMEYPTNLSPHQSFIRVKENKFAICTFGSGEHEVINRDGKGIIALTLYRALDVFSKGYFPYRPGRPSGRPSIAPKAQLKDTKLEFNFKLFTKDIENEKLFGAREQFRDKPSFIDGNWSLEDVLPKFDTDIKYYGNFKKHEIHYPTNVPFGMVLTSVYKNAYGDFIARYLNVSEKEISWDVKNKYSFNIFEKQNPDFIKIPAWKLINIFI